MYVVKYKFWGIDKDCGPAAVEKCAGQGVGPQNKPTHRRYRRNYRKLPVYACLCLAESAGKYVWGLREITQIDTSADSKQVSTSIDWYRFGAFGIDGKADKKRCHFVHVKVGYLRKGLAFLNIP